MKWPRRNRNPFTTDDPNMKLPEGVNGLITDELARTWEKESVDLANRMIETMNAYGMNAYGMTAEEIRRASLALAIDTLAQFVESPRGEMFRPAMDPLFSAMISIKSHEVDAA